MNTTLDGTDLDLYCNEIDGTLHQLLAPITYQYVPAEGPIKEGYTDPPTHCVRLDLSDIPSDDQRVAFLLMRMLLQSANSLTGTLRYDLCADHTDCPEHDAHVRRTVTRILHRLANFDGKD
jgi:hypothetical protein